MNSGGDGKEVESRKVGEGREFGENFNCSIKKRSHSGDFIIL